MGEEEVLGSRNPASTYLGHLQALAQPSCFFWGRSGLQLPQEMGSPTERCSLHCSSTRGN